MFDWEDPTSWSILLVDDEPDNLELVHDTLMFLGATVKAVPNGIEALNLLKEFTPNIMVLDLSMPEMDGWTLRERIVSQRQFQEVPIIAMTAHAMVGDRERALEAGFDGYISKPINVPTLVTDLRKSIEEKQQLD